MRIPSTREVFDICRRLPNAEGKVKRSITLAAGLVCAGLAPGAGPLSGQDTLSSAGQHAPPLRASTTVGTAVCPARAGDGDAFLEEVERARGLGDAEAAMAALDALETEARQGADASPNDVAAQYHLAASMGARLEYESGRAKMAEAGRVRVQAERVLALDPRHAGASYMLGRLHASILRMSGFKRFMARELFGGNALEGASWEAAQSLLEIAAREEPCVPEHHFELGRVYAARGEKASAAREFESVRELTAGREGRDARLRERAEELGRRL